jgi:riboflavin kinase/FMN adenylyltransferase
VLGIARKHADERGLPMYVVTFDPHPAVVLRPEVAPKMIGTLADRLERLAAAGADAVLVVPFTAQLAATTAEQAVRAVVADGLHAQVVVVGADFRFGSGAAGDVSFMRAMGSKHGFIVDAVELQTDDVDRFSSTRVRELLALGDVAGAARILGRPYAVTGPVVRGEQRGRDLGFPTANVELPEELASPLDGVYAGWLVDGADRYPAAISVGDNPTFLGASHRVEAYVLDRSDLDLYGKKVSIEFVDWIRDMVPFDGLEALIEAMKGDVEATRGVLGR